MPRRPGGRQPIRFERSAKPGGGFRLLSYLDPADLRHLQRIVAGLGPRIEASLGPEVRANRLAGRGSALMPWRPARRVWAAEIDRSLRTGPRSVLVTDVRAAIPRPKCRRLPEPSSEPEAARGSCEISWHCLPVCKTRGSKVCRSVPNLQPFWLIW
jgi:hypothetical protein